MLAIAKEYTAHNSSSDTPLSIFKVYNSNKKQKHDNLSEGLLAKLEKKFPPSPPSASLHDKIIRCFCKDTKPDMLKEQGCTVCRQLVTDSLATILVKDLTPYHLKCLVADGSNVTRKERLHNNDLCVSLMEPVLAPNCNVVCNTCWQSLCKGQAPKMALVNNMWYGEVPHELKGLSYIEKFLISRV